MNTETVGFLRRVCTDLKSVSAKIDIETSEVVATGDHIAIIRHFDHVRKAAELIKAAREELKDLEDRLSKDHVPEAMRAAGVKNVFVEDVGKVIISHRFSASMLDKELGMDWLRKNGGGDLIQPTVNAQTLGAWAKELLEAHNKELPPELFKTGTSPYTSIRAK